MIQILTNIGYGVVANIGRSQKFLVPTGPGFDSRYPRFWRFFFGEYFFQISSGSASRIVIPYAKAKQRSTLRNVFKISG